MLSIAPAVRDHAPRRSVGQASPQSTPRCAAKRRRPMADGREGQQGREALIRPATSTHARSDRGGAPAVRPPGELHRWARPRSRRCRRDLPEVAFAGRSNVGKSSLVNALTGRRTLARISNTPGRTRQINFFDLDERADAGRPAGLRLRPGVAKAMIRSAGRTWRGLSARPPDLAARLPADRRPPRHQGGRPRGHGRPRHGRASPTRSC